MLICARAFAAADARCRRFFAMFRCCCRCHAHTFAYADYADASDAMLTFSISCRHDTCLMRRWLFTCHYGADYAAMRYASAAAADYSP